MIKKEIVQQYVSAFWEYLIISIKKIFKGEDRIQNLDDLRNFIQTKSSIITQRWVFTLRRDAATNQQSGCGLRFFTSLSEEVTMVSATSEASRNRRVIRVVNNGV